MRIHFGIPTLLVVIALVAAFFPFDAFYRDWFRASYSGYHIHSVLGHRVTNGDSFEYVSGLFDWSEARTEQWTQKHYAPFPDYEAGDEYHVFHVGEDNVRAFFQFRGGLVVNHNNSLFHTPYPAVQHLNDKAPILLFRYGALPVYALLVALAGIAFRLVTYLVKGRHRIAGRN
ncbi:MAG: hypothetical protein ACI87E_005117 [Mariniblastus sp.]|jgi:hypothetical protein